MNWFTSTGGRYNYNSNYFIDQNTGFSVGDEGKILKTTNAGINWVEKQSNTVQNLNEVQFVDGNVGYICGDTGVVIKTSDGGENWQMLSTGITDNLNGINFYDLNLGFTVSKNSRILKTTNGGLNWSITLNNPIGSFESVSKTDNSSIYYLTTEVEIYKTTNTGLTWNLMTNQYGGKKIYFLDSLNGYTVGGSFTVRTSNGGLNWILQNTNVNAPQCGIHFVNINNGYAVGSEGTISRTTNGGSNWTPQTKITNNRLLSVFFTDADNGYITGDYGTLLKTTNGGLTFISENIDFHPDDFTLFQNYPNPFNSSTVIKYDLKKPGLVELKLYDVTGKEIQKLVKEYQSAGSYRVLFSSTENNFELNSGFFFTHYI